MRVDFFHRNLMVFISDIISKVNLQTNSSLTISLKQTKKRHSKQSGSHWNDRCLCFWAFGSKVCRVSVLSVGSSVFSGFLPSTDKITPSCFQVSGSDRNYENGPADPVPRTLNNRFVSLTAFFHPVAKNKSCGSDLVTRTHVKCPTGNRNLHIR